MKTPFDDWLAEKRRARKGGAVLRSGSRGRAFRQPMLIPGDFSGASWRGQVRIHPDAEALLASFTFSAGVYNAAIGKTLVTFSLPGGSGADGTGSLPLPTDGSTIAVFPFEVLCTPAGGTEDEFLAGAIPIIGRVAV